MTAITLNVTQNVDIKELAQMINDESTVDQVFELIQQLELKMADEDFLIRVYRHFRREMERNDTTMEEL